MKHRIVDLRALLAFALLFIVAIGCYGESIVHRLYYKGNVSFEDSVMYPYTVTLYKDTIVLAQKNFNSRSFIIDSRVVPERILVSSLGFNDGEIKFHGGGYAGRRINDTLYVAPVHLGSSSVGLREVVVESRKAVVKARGMNYTVSNVRGSFIGRAGTLMDMLAWTPGISVTNGENIKVLGRGGSPLVYINGVQVMDKSELKTLTSDNVSRIEVIREPGAEYPMGTSAVINITTVKLLSDMLNLEVSETASLRRCFSNSVNANMFGSYKKFGFNASLSYAYNNSRQTADYWVNSFTKEGAPLADYVFKEGDRLRSNGINWFAGAHYSFSRKQRLLLQYNGSSSKAHRLFDTRRSISKGGTTIDEHYLSDNASKPNRHALLGHYTNKTGHGDLSITLTYTNSRSSSTEEIDGLGDEALSRIDGVSSKYNLLTFKSDYKWKFNKKDTQSAGIYLGYSDNNLVYDNRTDNSTQNVKGRNKWAEAYYSTRVAISAVTLTAGLRGRYEHNAANNSNGFDNYSNHHLSFAPSAGIDYSFNDDYALSAFYRYSYDLPTFRQLNPAIRPSNLVFYTQGNPDLKQSNTHRVNITANLKNFTVIGEYYNYHNQIFDIMQPYGDGSFLTRPINMSGSYDWLLAVEHNWMPSRKFMLYTRALLINSKVEFDFMNRRISNKTTGVQFNLDCMYNLGNMSVFMSANYNSPIKVENKNLGYTANINVGVDYTMLKGRLYMRLEGTDLLGKSVTPKWTEYSPMLSQRRINRYDTRGVSLSIRYYFTSVMSSFRRQGSAADARRIE
ncbi:hypothetical protein IMSAGC008_01813 [Muribaculaceae bacterium]|jgi:hypothetical protein|nr:hypothetical protein IMSAGC008_01813 [Muribaculaceae bacterium]